MTQLSASQARQDFLKILNRVYAGEEFVVTKNKIQVARISPVGKEVKKVKKRILPGATKLLSHLKGTNVEIANWLRETAWNGNYGD